MVERRLTAAAPWLRVLIVYAFARVVTTLLVALSSALAPADGRHGQDPSMLDYIAGWDAAWYREIALNGYPSDLPVDDSGAVQQNAWAFMPIFPFLARGLAAVWPGAGIGSADVWAVANAWAVAAALVSLVAGFFACWAVFVLLERALDAQRALWGAAFVAAGPLALMFQVGYAEALFLAIAMWALVALSREAWWWLYPASVLLAFIRPGELALPLTVALYGIWRILNRRDRPIARRDVVHILGTGAVGTIAGFAWPVIVNAVTGSASAYFDTELAWRAGWIAGGADGFIPGEGWLAGASVWSGLWGIPPWAGYLLLAVVVAGAAALFLTPGMRALGIETRLWAVSYLIYTALVLFPQSSTFRLLLPIAPLVAGALAAPRLLRSSRILILVALTALQFWWIHAMYGHGNTYFLIP